jgi:hypothetical protein
MTHHRHPSKQRKQPSGKLVADRSSPAEWEHFHVIQQGSHVRALPLRSSPLVLSSLAVILLFCSLLCRPRCVRTTASTCAPRRTTTWWPTARPSARGSSGRSSPSGRTASRRVTTRRPRRCTTSLRSPSTTTTSSSSPSVLTPLQWLDMKLVLLCWRRSSS